MSNGGSVVRATTVVGLLYFCSTLVRSVAVSVLVSEKPELRC